MARSTRPPLTRRTGARIQALEARLMFDAAAVADVVQHNSQATTDAAAAVVEQTAAQREAAPAPVAAPGVAAPAHELVFIDNSIDNWEALAARVRPGAELVVLQAGSDPWAQMTQAIVQHQDITAVHLLSHGNEGQLIIGGHVYAATDGSLQAHADELAQWQSHMTVGADILLYGCSVAAGNDGQVLVDTLARLTHEDVAASTDATGNRAQANWVLESSSGSIAAAALDFSGADWQGELDTTVYNANNATLNFNGATATRIAGSTGSSMGTGNGDVVRFNNVITINGQAIDAVVTTTLPTGVTVSQYDSTSNPSNICTYFQPNLSVASNAKGSGATFTIEFYKGGTYTGAGTGEAVTLQNVVVNAYDLDSAGNSNSDRQYQDFKGFARYELANNTYVVPTTLSDGSVRFEYTTNSPQNNGTITNDGFRVRVYYDSISTFQVKSGVNAAASGSWSGTAYFALDFSLGPSWSGPTTITGTPAPAITYSTTTFAEAAANDGSMGNTATITLSNGTFAGTDGEPLSGVIVSNVPAGMTAVVRRTDATHATLALEGHATSHANANDIANLTVTFGNAAFTSGNAGAVTGATRADLVVDFADPPSNTAPVLADTALGLTVLEDAAAPVGAVGTLVGTLTGGISDADPGAVKGIAIVGSDESNGIWYYSTNGGSTWSAVGAVSASSALLLADDGNTRVYFQPGSQFNGSVPAALTVRAWDRTTGAAGGRVEIGGTAFSAATDTVGVTVTPVNDPPSSDSASRTFNEDSTCVLSLGDFPFHDQNDALSNAGSNAPLAVRISTLPGAGRLTLGGVAVNAGDFVSAADIAAGKLVFTPDANAFGTNYARLYFQWQDDGGTADGGIDLDPTPNFIAFHVLPVNDAPVAGHPGAPDWDAEAGRYAVTTPEDTPRSGTVAGSDVDGDTLNYAVTTGPAHGSVTMDAGTGAWVYTPAANYRGADSFVVDVSDGQGGVTPATVDVTVTPVNHAPVAGQTGTPDWDAGAGRYALTTPQDTPRSGTVAGSDVDGDTLSYTVATGSAHGSVTIDSGTGVWVYTPAANYHGADSFVVDVSDGQGGVTPVTVAVTVLPVAPGNQAPVPGQTGTPDWDAGAGGYAVTTPQDTPRTGTVSGSDAEGDTLTYAAGTGPAHGSVTIDAGTGAWIYTPDAGFNGGDRFQVQVSDGHGGNTLVWVDVTVQAAPPPLPLPEPTPLPTGLPTLERTAAPIATPAVPTPQAFDSALRNGAAEPLLVIDSRATLAVDITPRIDQSADLSDIYTRPSGFRIVVNASAEPMLKLYRGVGDQVVKLGQVMNLQVPADTFVHTQVNETVTLQATLADGQPLPGWLRFDGKAGTLVGEPPKDWDRDLAIRIVARDSQGREAVAMFRIKVTTAGGSRGAGLSHQLQRGEAWAANGSRGWQAQRQAGSRVR